MRARVAVAAVVLLVACGSLEGPRTASISPPVDALAAWRNFPADAKPRPIVLLGETSPPGFEGGPAKEAAICAKFVLSVELEPALDSHAFGGTNVQWSTSSGATTKGGRDVTFTLIGGPPDGPCSLNYTGVVAESPQAVAVGIQSAPGRSQGGPIGSCDLIGYTRSVTVTLASPLGGRVLVDASGYAVPVTALPG